MGKLIRRLLVAVLGAPVCPGCFVHSVDCVGWCGESDDERKIKYIRGGAKALKGGG